MKNEFEAVEIGGEKMENESEVKVCKNKKCQKVLPEGYKYKYCEACRNKKAQTTKKIFSNIGKGAATVASLALVVMVKKGKK